MLLALQIPFVVVLFLAPLTRRITYLYATYLYCPSISEITPSIFCVRTRVILLSADLPYTTLSFYWMRSSLSKHDSFLFQLNKVV